MVNNVIGMVNYVIAARPSLLNFMIADISARTGCCISLLCRRDCGSKGVSGLITLRPAGLAGEVP
jgi:hypothetical protein